MCSLGVSILTLAALALTEVGHNEIPLKGIDSLQR